MFVRRIRSCLLALPLIAAAVAACAGPGGGGSFRAEVATIGIDVRDASREMRDPAG